MIPTREQIDRFEMATELTCHTNQGAAWLRDMRAEIDRLTAANEAGGAALLNEQREAAKVRAELKAADDDAIEESDRADRNAELVAKLRAELDATKAQRDMLHRRLYPTPCKGCPGCSSYADCPDEIHRLTTALDAAHTDAALARDANNGEVQLLKSQLQLAIERIERVSVKADSAEHWERVAKKAEAALARDALAKATTPAPDREAAIRAWEKEALFDMYEHADDDEETHRDDVFLVRRSEIIAAVALMRSAGDGKALLRELRAWIIDEKWCAPGIVRKIDEMLAQPAPSHVYSRGRTIAESAEPPTAYHPPAPVEIWPEEMKRQTLVGKFEPAPVEQPAAAVPDDTRELVAQLADLFKVHLSCNGGVNRLRSDRAAEIAAKLRRSK